MKLSQEQFQQIKLGLNDIALQTAEQFQPLYHALKIHKSVDEIEKTILSLIATIHFIPNQTFYDYMLGYIRIQIVVNQTDVIHTQTNILFNPGTNWFRVRFDENIHVEY